MFEQFLVCFLMGHSVY